MGNNVKKTGFILAEGAAHAEKPKCLPKYAFTLAEVLVTLGIIGVVAAMTMPTLLNDTGNQQYVAKLKKVNSMLGQATIRAVEEHGMIQDWGFRDGSDAQVNRIFEFYKPYFNIIKDCGNDANGGECVAKTKLLTLAGNPVNGGWANGTGFGGNVRTFVLSDGTSLVFDGYGADATAHGVTRNTMTSYMLIIADMNGPKKPNRLGRDTFLFVLTQDGIVPGGADMTPTTSDCKTGGVGFHCAAKVIQENDMNY